MKSDLIEIAGEIIGETEKAYKFSDGKSEAWVPKSQVEWDPDAKEMTMPEWLAKEKEFI